MKTGIHPDTKDITVTCSCGHSFQTSSAHTKDMHIDVCNKCHPFYTGKQKIIDTAGRVDRFNQRFKGLMGSKKGAESSKDDKK